MYKAPVEEIAFTLKHVAGLTPALDGGHLGDLTDDLVDAILSEAGRFATEEVAPLAEIGDRQGARLANHNRENLHAARCTHPAGGRRDRLRCLRRRG